MRRSWTCGSDESCDIRVPERYVSGRHCRLERCDDEWFLEDLGSTNGTFVNGEQVAHRRRVSPSDVITLGRSHKLPWPSEGGRRPGAATLSVPLPPVGKSIVLGRAATCDVVLDFPMVSSRHAAIEHGSAGWTVRDLGSTNGTFVGGRRITGSAAVGAGDVIGLGSYQLRLSGDGRGLTEEDRRDSAVLEANGLAVVLDGRRLIGDVSLVVRSGELVGIMGPSGAGKSTLLSALVGCQPPSEGRVLVSAVDLYARQDEFRGQIGYVPQDDIMHPDLTVGQALWYSARLRLPRDYTDEEIRGRISSVTAQLGLDEVLETRIGSAERRGISGGQRKRVNVAMELITDPPVLVLDEPTSGLSSTDALALMRLLRGLASSGKIVILTIHQPGVELLRLMDGLAVVAKDESSDGAGEIVWFGQAYPDAARFFDPDAGRPDADAVMRGLGRRTVAEWRVAYRRTAAHEQWTVSRRSPTGSAPLASPRARASFKEMFSQTAVLARRMFAIKAADTWSTAVLLAQAPLIGLLIAGTFGPKIAAPVDAAHWPDVSRALATTTFLMGLAAIWFGCSNAAREVVGERAIYKRERMAGMSGSAYVASKVIVLAALCGVQCAMLALIVRAGVGLETGFGSIFWPLFLAANVATAIGLCVSAVVRSAEAAAGVLPLVILPMVILGGVLLPLPELPRATTLVADAMPSRWVFEKLLTAEADVRPLIEVPSVEDPTKLKKEDMAEGWFPAAGWRTKPGTPMAVLATMWGLAVLALPLLLIRRERLG
jgi:ABC-type multidrug transport system ATPase subunit/pSer/pThr/pTyr-binding forkhead associated (FHA) protein